MTGGDADACGTGPLPGLDAGHVPAGGLAPDAAAPEAIGARLAYALVANVLVGTVVAGVIVKRLVRRHRPLDEAAAGFGSLGRTWWPFRSPPQRGPRSTCCSTYHVAHSPPFNTLAMIAGLTAIGLVTSAFFLGSRDVYATIVFHNFFALVGVVGALAAADRLDTYTTVPLPLVGLGLGSLVALILVHMVIVGGTVRGVRPGHRSGTGPPVS